uniref:Osmotically inducible protein OsmC n=1 Tax=uncultured Thiotrichaceae bacterium TaxID=298394 RepID=A0A6S6ULE1_9GAMM|nr:MAG: Osmotically inducible protein OsmC [uncultured Thiotrichaceae bacterium]
MDLHAKDPHTVVSSLAAKEGYTCNITAGKHPMVADEPIPLGGEDLGATPYELLKAALASCTSITLRMYAERKEWSLDNAIVTIRHSRDGNKESVFERDIQLIGDLDDSQRERLMAIADRCPVHKTISHGATILSKQID